MSDERIDRQRSSSPRMERRRYERERDRGRDRGRGWDHRYESRHGVRGSRDGGGGRYRPSQRTWRHDPYDRPADLDPAQRQPEPISRDRVENPKPYTSEVAEYGKYVEECTRDLAVYSSWIARGLHDATTTDTPTAASMAVRIAMGLQTEAAMLTGDPEFEVVGVRERSEFAIWTNRVCKRIYDNKASVGEWLSVAGLRTRSDSSSSTGAEWNWTPITMTIVASVQ